MSLKREFVNQAALETVNMRELCRRFGVSPPTGYKWLKRWKEQGTEGLKERSRRPGLSPGQTPAPMQQAVLAARREHPAWGGRKLRKLLLNRGLCGVPSASTITEIVRRHGLLEEPESQQGGFRRFERSEPNGLWQMDFKGHFELTNRGRCHPLGILDDHSRFNISLRACADERGATVKGHLERAFERYGLPVTILCDNGPPWGSVESAYTTLGVWLLQLGVEVIHGRPYHPQTQGKEERFHRTLEAEVLKRTSAWKDLEHCAREFAGWREIYNFERPHEALAMQCPGEVYRGSTRRYKAQAAPEQSYYLPSDVLRRVKSKGEITFKNTSFYIANGFRGKTLALRPVDEGCWDVYFCWKKLGRIDLSRCEGKPKGNYEKLLRN